MKKYLLPLLTAFFICFSCSKESTSLVESSQENNVAKIIILAGQSNMEGNSCISELGKHYSDDEIEIWKKGFSTSKIMYDNSWGNYTSLGGFTNPKLGQGCDANHFGPELGIAETINNYQLDQPVYILKCAWGGSNLYNHWHSPSSGETGLLYSYFISFVNNAISLLKSRGFVPQIHALCWMQGESDSETETHASEYYEHLSNFVTDFRNEFDKFACQSGIGFIDAYISNSYVWPFYKTINEAKQKFANESILNVSLDTISMDLPYSREPTYSIDWFHYDSDGMINLGRAFGEELFNNFLW